jgi:hypothetical protein
MHAKVGDRIVVHAHRFGEHQIADCEVIEVHGDDGGPPYLVRWDDGHESLYFPGSDADVEPYEQPHR